MPIEVVTHGHDEFDGKSTSLMEVLEFLQPQLSIADTHQRILDAREKFWGSKNSILKLNFSIDLIDMPGYCGLKNIAHDAIWNAAVHEWRSILYGTRKVQQIVLVEKRILSGHHRNRITRSAETFRVWDIAGWENASSMVSSFSCHICFIYFTHLRAD